MPSWENQSPGAIDSTSQDYTKIYGYDPFSTKGKPRKLHHGWSEKIGGLIHGAEKYGASSIAGLYEAGKQPVLDITHPIPGHSRTAALLETLGTQVVHDIEHPGRNPLNTALDIATIVPIVGWGAKAGQIGKLVKEGKTLGEARKAVYLANKRQIRYVTQPGREAIPTGSYAPKYTVLGQAQRKADVLRTKGYRVGPRSNAGRYGNALAKRVRIEEALAKAPATVVAATSAHVTPTWGLIPKSIRQSRISKGLTPAEQEALRVVQEGVPVDKRLAYMESQLPDLKGRYAAEMKANISRLKEIQAKGHVVDVNGVLSVNPANEHLLNAHNLILGEGGIGGREQIFQQAGVLSPEAMAARRQAVGNLITHGETNPIPHDPAIVAQAQEVLSNPSLYHPDQVTAAQNIVAREPFTGGQGYVPFSRTRGSSYTISQGAGRRISLKTRLPGSVIHSLKGTILRTGGGRHDVTRLVAESNLEAQKFATTGRLKNWAKHNSDDTPDMIIQNGGRPVAVRIDTSAPVSPRIAEILHKAEVGTITHLDEEELGGWLDQVKEHYFPKDIPFGKVAGYRWIDERELGGMNLPRVSATGGIATARELLDFVNNMQRIGLLYLKPSYILPNVLGNTAMLMIRQGPIAAVNLGRAYRLWRQLGKTNPELLAKVDAVMGEGLTHSLQSSHGLGAHATQLIAQPLSTIVDRPFRWASFYSEASKHGYRTEQDINRLLDLNAPKAISDLRTQIVHDANNAVIDYGDLTDFEKTVVRRALFIYPWVKGSTVYTGRFLGEHPFQAAITGQMATYGAQAQEQQLGELPGWARQLVRVGGTSALPTVLNPSSAGIFGQTSDVISTITGHPQFEALGQTQPSLQALYSFLTRKTTLGKDIKGSRFNALRQLYEGLPAYQFEKRMFGHQIGKTYHLTRPEAFLRYVLLGGLTPVQANRARLNRSARIGK